MPEVHSAVLGIRRDGERAACNMPIQAMAADILKLAMLALERSMGPWEEQGVRLLMQVHDELIWSGRREVLDVFKPWAKGVIESAVGLDVPVVVDGKIGKSWGELK